MPAKGKPPTPRRPSKFGGYGWKPQLPDLRDAIAAIPATTSLPGSVDLSASPNMPPVYDQGQLESCTANSLAAAVDFANHAQTQAFLTPSRLWIWYQERVIENTVSQNVGAMIRDGAKVVASLGVCPETEWPYDANAFADTPPQQDYTDALKDRVLKYAAVQQNLFALKNVLAGGRPVVFGFAVYESFESDQVKETGIVPMPSPSESSLGGHAVVLVGYNDAVDRFRVRNSWGAEWGQAGYFEMPYLYVTSASLASDFWTLETVNAK